MRLYFNFVKKAFRGIITKMSCADEQNAIAVSSAGRKRMRLDDNATIEVLAENKQLSAKLETLELSNNSLQKTAEEYQKKAEELSAENEVYEFICYTLNWTF